MAKRQGADEVIYLPTEELVSESIGKTKFRPNEGRPRKKKAKRTFEEPTMELYGGFDGFLVRTALIRATDYDERDAPTITSPPDVISLVAHLAQADQEHMVVIAISSSGKLMAIHESAIGGLASAPVEIRQLIKVGYLTGAPALFMVHNHPSGRGLPSQDDLRSTRRAIEALRCVDLQLLDHIIIGRDGSVSLRSSFPREAGFE